MASGKHCRRHADRVSGGLVEQKMSQESKSSAPTAAPNTAAQCTPLRSGLLILLLWCSGFCGISYEILYGRMLGNLLGDQFGVNAAVLLTFLLGIGVGTLWAHRIQRWLWAVELGIGVCGVASALLTAPLSRLLYSSAAVNLTGLGGAMVLSILLLSVPAFLIGVTLPLFAGYLNRATGKAMFAHAYLAYNLGAAVTALVIEYWLVRRFGLSTATLLVAMINAVVCAGIFFGFKDFWRDAPRKVLRPEKRPWPAKRLMVALCAASFASAIFQLTMIKVAEGFLGPYRETFALTLTVTLLGIAVGSEAVRMFRLSLANVLWLALAGLTWLLWRQESLFEAYAAAYPTAVETASGILWLKVMTLVKLMGLPAAAFGATIPALLTDESAVSRDSGRLLFLSSVANAAGFLILALVLHSHFEYGSLILIVVGLTAAALACAQGLNWRAALAPLAGLAIMSLSASKWNESLIYLGHTKFHSSAELAEARAQLEATEVFKGQQDNFSITSFDGSEYLLINGYHSIVLDSWAEKGVGTITSAYAPRLDHALVLGLGAGATASTVGLAFDQTDVIEINPTLAANQPRFGKHNFNIADNPRVNIIVDDGIHHVRATDRKYSLILNTVTSPLYFSSSKLYTKDFLLDVQKRLTPDGIYMTWLDIKIGEKGVETLLNTVSKVFPHCRLACIRSSYFLLIASSEPPRVWHPEAGHKSPVLRDYYFVEKSMHPGWMPYAVIVADAYELIADPAGPINTLDHPTLEFLMASLGRRDFGEFQDRVKQSINPAKLKETSTDAFTWNPAYFDYHINDTLGEENEMAIAVRAATRPLFSDFDIAESLANADFFRDRTAVTGTADDHYWHGVWARRGGQYDRAIAAENACLAIDPKYNNAWYCIGLSEHRRGNLEAAAQGYLNELNVDPEDEDVAPRVGRIRFEQNRHEEAVEWLTKALSLKADADLFMLRAQAYEKLGQRRPAEADFRNALMNAEDKASRYRALEGLLRMVNQTPK